MTYPDGEMVTHNYNNRMLLNSLIGTRTEAHAELRDSFERVKNMDKYKDFISRYKKYLFFSLVAIFSGFGVYIGYITVDSQKVMVNASLGLTVLYLLYKKYFRQVAILTELLG